MASLYRIAAGMLACCLGWGGPAGAVEDPYAAAVARARAAHPVAIASLGLLLVDVRTGAVRYAAASDAPMQPASLMKLLTSAAAWRQLGPASRFTTRILGDGPVRQGRLAGDLYLVGGGDPSLRRAHLDELARQLRLQGLVKVQGGLGLDTSHLATPSHAPGWVVDDLEEAYAAPVTALVLEDNVATHSGKAVAVTDPTAAMGVAWSTALASAGIRVERGTRRAVAPATARELARVESLALTDLLPRLNKDSHNLSAECVFRALGDGEPMVASRHMAATLERMGVASADLRIADGSGLSRYDLATPRAIAAVLLHMAGEPGYRASLSVAGRDGTLRRRFADSPLAERLLAKTGTMAGVAGVAGYLEAGGPQVVVLMANGFTGSARSVHALLDAILAGWDALLRQRQDFSSSGRGSASWGTFHHRGGDRSRQRYDTLCLNVKTRGYDPHRRKCAC